MIYDEWKKIIKQMGNSVFPDLEGLLELPLIFINKQADME